MSYLLYSLDPQKNTLKHASPHKYVNKMKIGKSPLTPIALRRALHMFIMFTTGPLCGLSVSISRCQEHDISIGSVPGGCQKFLGYATKCGASGAIHMHL